MSPLSRTLATSMMAPFIANALQHSEFYPAEMEDFESRPERPLTVITLDKEQATKRGAFCLDGGPGSYYYSEGTSKNSWVLAFEGGTAWCRNFDMCGNQAKHGSTPPAHVAGNDLSIFRQEPFRNYNHVIFYHCDGGLGMGNRDQPVDVGGRLIYMRGKRIIDHTIDDLVQRLGFGSAEEVVVTGGSGGGQSTYLLADYLGTRMPKTVRKFGAVPMNGWWSMKDRAQTDGYILHNMTSAIVPSCRDALPEKDQWKCIHTDIAYGYSKTPFFVIQLLDYRSVSKAGPGRALKAWHACMFNDEKECPQDHVNALTDLMDEVVSDLQSSSKYNGKNEGGFVSTCTKHTFYRQKEFFHYAKDGVKVSDAISDWWVKLGTAGNNTWYLPCHLNAEFPHQCERSCDFGTNGEDQHADDGFR